ncbi:hypothetical protein CEP45_03595 [Mergibacter septicus]|uniref:type II toxin-antitoxin system RelE/ParE family toxin n=1 Tax=Mergibacter septicus TaxID=221402 RepID=UPI001C740FA2|nr:type II toxin-antitoxin system RelE/ParE family toxin [Mergibacter septicus]QDJ12986.1 hypothetical protein CEP45_03595 [Mergibacter septicus]
MSEKYFTLIETRIFEEDRKALLSDDEYQVFQTYLLANYDKGDVITQTGGCRKIRWKLSSNNKGKSGGVRVIYYVLTQQGKLYLLVMYPKNVKDNLTEKEKAQLKEIVEQLRKE